MSEAAELGVSNAGWCGYQIAGVSEVRGMSEAAEVSEARMYPASMHNKQEEIREK